MTVEITAPAPPGPASPAGELSREELDALVAAATWYAKYHESIIAELEDDVSTAALAQRERFQTLHGALAKLGVRLRRPAGIRAA